MPIYVYKCEGCGLEVEVIQQMGVNDLNCPRCKVGMSKKPTCQAFVCMKGYPSFRRQYLGTAPYTSRISPSKVKGGLGAKHPAAKMEGEKWLESIE